MPIGAQPRGRRGTVGHPDSALNLRLAFAAFGLVTCALFATLLFLGAFDIAGWFFVALAGAAAVDMVVVGLRRRARRRADRDEHSLFE